jgi:hypothetical protein
MSATLEMPVARLTNPIELSIVSDFCTAYTFNNSILHNPGHADH